ncbi:hypothetical protein K466DRAFT_537804 [Polyporus arcularius HHB13444]|uniref:C2H2-type domain-containing protein n=1 Tax=Polyporus arcularius HHB13444 TaxID=1314778 RepID=A0A5C3PXL7_9APHY|nr:hypothetical protein K466DRAFT_537804 [Polyporus arcularius HHB13444]
MSERGVGKPWTTQEDNLLIQAVAIHGENDNWKAVATLVPGRTNKACRKRWLHSLSPNVKKTAWTPEEDQLLLSLYATHGTKWSVIARRIPGRTDDACSKRYREALDPSLKRDDWTYDEDVKLLEVYARLGGKWGLIGQELNRSGLGCRNRWRMLERKRAALSRDATSRGEGPSSVSEPPGTSSPQWTPTHVQEPQFWDGRSPQYVTPSVLYQGSPLHPQESHGTTYSPDQILSGVHLNGSSSSQRDPPPFQYSAPSLSAALSHPGSVAESPEPHEYYRSGAYASSHGPSGLSEANASAPAAQSGTYGSHEYDFMTIDDHHHSSTSPEPSHHSSAPANEYAGPLDLGIQPLPIPDTPASPSPCGSPSPPGSPACSAGNQTDGPAASGICVDPPDPPRRSYYRTAEEKVASQPPPRPSIHRPARLSSTLPATSDPSVLAYACGHSDCWPAGASSSKNAFLTSKELSDHSRFIHGGDLGGSKPFRCGLAGCEKSWKSPNGLQYHLQISRYHFQQALAGRGGDPDVAGIVAPTAPTTGNPRSDGEQSCNSHQTDVLRSTAEPDAQATPATPGPPTAPREDLAENSTPEKPKRKLHPCTRPGCTKAYKQLSGLRYHLTHGHADELPLQLDVVPPTLARLVAEKAFGSPSQAASAPRP